MRESHLYKFDAYECAVTTTEHICDRKMSVGLLLDDICDRKTSVGLLLDDFDGY